MAKGESSGQYVENSDSMQVHFVKQMSSDSNMYIKEGKTKKRETRSSLL